MIDKQQLAAMGEHIQEEISWRNKDSPNGIRKFMTESQYQNQSDAIKQYYEPYRCANCMDSEFKVPDGWKLVPIDPTDSMCYDGQQAGSTAYADPDGIAIVDLWEAVLAAAPEYKP